MLLGLTERGEKRLQQLRGRLVAEMTAFFCEERLGHNLESMHFTAFSIQLAFYVILLGFDLGKHNILEHELE